MDKTIKYTKQELLKEMQARIDRYKEGLSGWDSLKELSEKNYDAPAFISCFYATHIYGLLIKEVGECMGLVESMDEGNNG
jgi:hypothetical protein